MALNMNTPEGYGYEIAALFGVPHSLLGHAMEEGVTISPSKSNPLKFMISLGQAYTGAVEIKGTAMTLAKAGTMGPASKQAIGAQFESQITQALKAGGLPADGAPDNGAGDKIQVQAKALEGISKANLKKMMMGGMDPAPKDDVVGVTLMGPDGTVVTTTSSQANVAKVPLHMAAQLGQAVQGTSSKSTYYMVAQLKGLNLAIRAKFLKLSVRVEGSDLSKYTPKLASLGFSVKSDYASAHFEVEHDSMVPKTVGAILGGLGMENLMGVMDVSKVVGK